MRPSAREAVVGKIFENEQVKIDGRNFVKCIFKDVELAFAGEDAFGFDECEMLGARLILIGAAHRTAVCLSMLYQSNKGFASNIEEMFSAIRRGTRSPETGA